MFVLSVTGQYVLPIAVPFVIAILALAFPIMTDASSKISDQYGSSILAKAFQKEFAFRGFKWMLYASLAAIVIYVLKIPVLARFADCWLIANSAILLVYVTTLLLVMSLLYLAGVLSAYYSQDKLFGHLKKRYKWLSRKEDFNAVSQMMFFSIDNADEELARSVFSFYIEAFIQFRKNKKGQEITYPEEFYNAIFEANERLCKRRKKTVSLYNDGTVYEFFIDSYQGTLLSQKTIRFMWMCVIQNVSFERYDYIFSLWKKLYQHTSLFLNNKTDSREEKTKFVEFAQMMCAYMLYKRQYDSLRIMLEFTQTLPAKYVLTPSSTQEVIDCCKKVLQHNNFGSTLFPVYYESLYPQPQVDGADAEYVLQERLFGFYAVSFLWQYGVFSTFQSEGYLDTVYQGTNVSDMKKTLEVLNRLNKKVEQTCLNESLLSALNLKGMSFDADYTGNKSPKQWFIDNIKSTTESVNKQEDFEERIAQIPEEYAQNYKERVSESWTKLMEEVKSCFDDSNKQKKTEKIHLTDRYDVQLKAHVLLSANFTEAFGDLLSVDFKANMWLPFLKMNVHPYILQEEDVIDVALNWKKRKGLVIFNFGVRIDEQKYTEKGLLKKVKGKLYTKNDIEIIDIGGYLVHSLITHSMIIVKQSDLPYMKIEDVDQSLKDELGLEPCLPENKVYTSVIDFNQPKGVPLQAKYCKGHKGEEEKYAMFCAVVNSSLNYNPEAKVVHLKVYNQFRDRTVPQRKDEVIDAWKKSSLYQSNE